MAKRKGTSWLLTMAQIRALRPDWPEQLVRDYFNRQSDVETIEKEVEIIDGDLEDHLNDFDNPHKVKHAQLDDNPTPLEPWEDQHHPELHDLDSHTDVSILAPKDGQGIWYQDSSGLWINRAAYEESWPTGLAEGGELNIVSPAGEQLIEVISGLGVITDSYTDPLSPPVVTGISWDLIQEPITAAPAAAGSVVWFSIRNTGVPASGQLSGAVPLFVGELVQYAVPPNPTLAREEIFLGVAVHNGVEWKEVSNPKVLNAAAETLREVATTVLPLTTIIQGGQVTELPGFMLDQAEGVVWENNRNWHVDKSDPNRETLPALSPIAFQYVTQDFTVGAPVTVVDPDTYDVGGVPTAVPGPANTTTIQRLYIDPANNYWMMYGQYTYANFFSALANLDADLAKSVVPFILQNSILLGSVVAEKAKTDWDPDEAVFVPAGSGGTGGSGGTPITDHNNLSGIGPNDHHNQAHEFLGPDHLNIPTEFPWNKPIGEPYFLIFTGQSNNVANDLSIITDTAMVTNPNVFSWQADGVTGGNFSWQAVDPTAPEPGDFAAQIPKIGMRLGSHGNIGWYAADQIQKATGRPVYMLTTGFGGLSIDSWAVGNVMNNTLLTQVAACLATPELAALDVADSFIWMQGEADGEMEIATYTSKFQAVIADAYANGWISPRFSRVSICDITWQNDQLPRTHNAFWQIDGLSDEFTRVIQSRDLEALADTVHFTGDSLNLLGVPVSEHIMEGPLPKDTAGLWNYYIPDYVEGPIYAPQNWAANSTYLSIANTYTTDPAFPVEVGDLIAVYPENPPFLEASEVAQVRSGYLVTFKESGEVRTLEVWIPEVTTDTHFSLVVVQNPNGTAPLTTRRVLANADLVAGEWNTVTLGSTLYIVGGEVLVYLESQNYGATTQVTGGWNYGGQENTAAPAAQAWNHNNAKTVLRIDKTDLDSTDRTTELLGIIVGATIQFAETANPANTQTYTVLADPTDAGTYIQYSVSLTNEAGTIPVGDPTTMTADVPVAQATKFVYETDKFLVQPAFADFTSFLQYDDVDQPVATTIGYGVNFDFQQLSQSPDWDLILLGSGGSGGGDFTPTIFTGAGTTGYVPDPVTEQGLFLADDGTWKGAGGATEAKITQAAHGLAPLDCIRFDGTSWVKALANDINTTALGIVVAVDDTNNFTFAVSGRYQLSNGFLTDEWYYLSDSVAGGVTATEPGISQPIIYSEASNWIIIYPYRPSYNKASTEPIVGEVKAFYGDVATLPFGWHLCDGTNGTPDWRGRKLVAEDGTNYPADAVGGEFDADSDTKGDHNHGGATGLGGGHSHTASTSIGVYNADKVIQSGGGAGATGAHSHSASTTVAAVADHNHSIANAGDHNHKTPESPYAVITGWIMYTGAA